MRQARHLHRVLILSHLAACVNRAAFFRRSRSKNRASVHAHTSTRVLNWRSRHNVNAIYVAVNGVTLSLFSPSRIPSTDDYEWISSSTKCETRRHTPYAARASVYFTAHIRGSMYIYTYAWPVGASCS